MRAIDRHLRMRCAKMQLHAMAIVEFFQTPEIFESFHYEFEFPSFSSTKYKLARILLGLYN